MMAKRLTQTAAILLMAVLPSCSDSTAGPPSGAGFSLNAGSPSATTLGTTSSWTVDVTSTHFSGPVTLSLSGLPSDWQIAFTPSATVDVTGGGTTVVTVEVTIPTNGTPAPAGQTLTIEGTASSGSVSTTTSLAVANEFVLPFVPGAGTGSHWGTYGGTTVTLNSGTLVRFANHDATGHIVHAGTGIPGLPHQPPTTMLATGEEYAVTVGAGTDEIYCHLHVRSATGIVTFNVQ